MKYICPKCFSVNDSNNTMLKGSLLGGTSLIAGGFLVAAGSLYHNQYLYLIMSVLFVILGILSTKNYFKKFSKICPNCKYENMPTINEAEGQQILAEHGMSVSDDSTHHCSNCGYGADSLVQSKIWSIVLIIGGILSLPFASALNIIALPGSLILIGVGAYGLWTNYRKNFKCPNCKKNTLIAIDSK